MKGVAIREVRCKSILNRSSMGFAEYTVNAYLGCAFGCSYCYVPVLRTRRGQIDAESWGAWVEVKTNAPDVLRRQMINVEPEARISIGTAADSWQPVERRYGIAREMLRELAYYDNPVQIVTRSPLLMRDIDLLQRMRTVWVGVSIPTFDEGVRRVFEPHAPTIPARRRLVRALVEAGVPVRLFWCPLLPGVTDNARTVREYLQEAAALGVRKVFCETMNYGENLGPVVRILRDRWQAEAGVRPEPSLSRAALAREIARWSAETGVACRL